MVRTLLAIVTAAPLLLGCAVFAQAEDLNNMTPDEMSLINATCSNVMGLRKGEYQYSSCQDSLSHSLARRDAAYRMIASDDACTRHGLRPGTAVFATCMLEGEHGTSAPPALQPVAFSAEATEAGKSYFNVSNGVKFQRERYSCAQLGLMPNSGLFGECVASLEGELLPDN